jgi:hypothetical protein
MAHGFPTAVSVTGSRVIRQVQVRLIILFGIDCQWPIRTFFLNNTRRFSI